MRGFFFARHSALARRCGGCQLVKIAAKPFTKIFSLRQGASSLAFALIRLLKSQNPISGGLDHQYHYI